MSARLIAITPGDCHVVDRVPWIHALAAAGLRTLMIREPQLDRTALDALLLNAWGSVPDVVVHDCNPHARAYRIPLHLPASAEPDGFPAPWSRSCHTAEEVDRALGQGASWVTLSPVFPPTSKPDDTRPVLGAARFAEIAGDRPVVALGGIDAERARLLRTAFGVAVLGWFFGAPSPGEAGRRCTELLSVL